MFGQLKDLYNLRKQAEELQKQMAAEKFTVTSGLVTLTLNGNQELVDVQVAPGEPAKIATDFKAAHKQAQDQLKQTMARKFQGMV